MMYPIHHMMYPVHHIMYPIHHMMAPLSIIWWTPSHPNEKSMNNSVGVQHFGSFQKIWCCPHQVLNLPLTDSWKCFGPPKYCHHQSANPKTSHFEPVPYTWHSQIGKSDGGNFLGGLKQFQESVGDRMRYWKNNFTTLYEFKFFNSLAIKNQRYKFVKKSYPSYMYDVP